MDEKQYFLRYDFPMKYLNSMNVAFRAALVTFPYTEKGVAQIYRDYSDRRIVILGAGSNSIFVKPYYDETTVLLVTSWLNNINFIDGNIVAGAGVSLSRLAWFACEKHLSGFEFMEDIPGSVGGGIIMNAGTYSECIKDVTVSVRFYNADTDSFIDYESTDLFGLRDSLFAHKKGVIVSACFTSKPGNYKDIIFKMTELKKERYLKQPRDFPSAGSVFKKPIINGIPTNVWTLIRDAGLAGCRIGGAQVSEKHTGFIVNVGGATGEDLLALETLCENEVKKNTGIQLVPEWKFID